MRVLALFLAFIASASAFTPMARPIKAAVKMSATNAVRGVPLLKGLRWWATHMTYALGCSL